MKIDPSTGRVVRDDLTNRTFGTVTVLGEFQRTSNGGTKWKYRCVCGNEGWAWAEILKRQPNFCCKECRRAVISKIRTTHGGRYTHEYSVWKNMIDRCENPNNKAYGIYGGRGIKVYDLWHDFAIFRDQIPPYPGNGLTIDRIDNNRGYEPGNVRWATPMEQLNNQRRNKFLTFNGKTQTWSQWARELNIDKTLIRQRANKGWPVEKVLSTERFRRA